MTAKERAFRVFTRCAARLLAPRTMRVWQRRFSKAERIAGEVLRLNNALVIYYSETGNTEKVATAIKSGIERAGTCVTLKKLADATQEDLYDYDLVCFGSPVLHSLPPAPVMDFIRMNDKRYRKSYEVILSAPRLVDKSALVFCTYSGVHCGLNEALPTGKYIRQFLEHLGFDVKDEWYEIGEFHGWNGANLHGRLGDIRGRPNDDDLALVELRAAQLAKSL